MVKYIIGIAGGSGVGKSTLLKILDDKYANNIAKITLDNYYLPIEDQQKDENGKINFDLPTALNIAAIKADIAELLSDKVVHRKKYNFNNADEAVISILIEPKPILIIEGLFVFHFDFINSILDLKVFITVDEKLQLQRRLERDFRERKITEEDALYQWHNHVLPSNKAYIEPYKDAADIVLVNNEKFDENILILEQKIEAVISAQ